MQEHGGWSGAVGLVDGYEFGMVKGRGLGQVAGMYEAVADGRDCGGVWEGFTGCGGSAVDASAYADPLS